MNILRKNGTVRITWRGMDGLTLVEVLVTVTILMLVLGLSYQGLNTLLLVQDRVPKDIARWSDLERVFDRLEYDFTNLSLMAPVAPNGHILYPLMLDPQKKYGALAPLMLSRFSRENDEGGDGQLVGYQLTGDTLELLIWPTLYLPLAGQNREPRIYPLLTKITQFKVEVLDNASKTWKTVYPENVNRNYDQAPPKTDATIYTPAELLKILPKALKVTLQRQDMAGSVSRIFDRVY